MDFLEMMKQFAGATAVDEYSSVLAELATDAVRWTMVGASGVKCTVRRRTGAGAEVCRDGAIGGCLACDAPVCLGHAMVSPGRILCFACVQAAEAHVEQMRSAGRVPPPYDGPPKRERGRPFGFVDDLQRQAERRKHLTELGLARGVGWDEIQARYRELARKYHPDRTHGILGAEVAEKRMKDINAAYSWLRNDYEKRAA